MKRPTTGLGSLQRPEATSASQAYWLAARWGSLAFLAWAGCTHCCRTVPSQKPVLKQRQQQQTTTARLWARASWMTGRVEVVITAVLEKNAFPQAPASCGVKGAQPQGGQPLAIALDAASDRQPEGTAAAAGCQVQARSRFTATRGAAPVTI